MTTREWTGADEAFAIGLLQQLSAMCDETRREDAGNPVRVTSMLASFDETLALLAPILERCGNSPTHARDNVLAAARSALDSHQAMLDTMALELDRIGRALADTVQGANAAAAYDVAGSGAPRQRFEAHA